MIPKVYDVRPDGHQSFSQLPRLGEDDYPALKAHYKMEVDQQYGYNLAKPGELYWALVAFELKAGPAVLQPQVLDIDGSKYDGPTDTHNVAVALYWPDADVLDPAWHPQYYNRAQVGWTEGRGDVGFGYGPEAHIGPNGGPYSVWVFSGGGKVGSDAAHRLGWWDDHITPNPIYQITKKGGVVEPPEDRYYLVDYDEDGAEIGRIEFVSGDANFLRRLALLQGSYEIGSVEWGPPRQR